MFCIYYIILYIYYHLNMMYLLMKINLYYLYITISYIIRCLILTSNYLCSINYYNFVSFNLLYFINLFNFIFSHTYSKILNKFGINN